MYKVQELVTGLIYLLTPFQIVLSCFSLSLHRVRYLSIITPTRCPLYLILYHFFRLQFVHIRNEKIKAPCSRGYNVSDQLDHISDICGYVLNQCSKKAF